MFLASPKLSTRKSGPATAQLGLPTKDAEHQSRLGRKLIRLGIYRAFSRFFF